MDCKKIIIALGVLTVINIGLIIGIIFAKKCKNNLETRNVSYLQQRIVGGQASSIEKTPYFAGILLKKGIYDFLDAEEFAQEDQYICGCTIIGNYWVITAAHCTQPFTEKSFPVENGYVRSGTDAWSHTRKTQKHMRDHWFRKIVQHEDYDERKLSKDISLIKVKQPFRGPFAVRIKLAARNYRYIEGTKCTVIGFGATSFEGGTATDRLRSVTIQIANYTACREAFDSLPDGDGIGLVNKWNFCAGTPKGGKDACKYDSGGPLVQDGVLIGIVSLGQDCGQAKYPGVYTKVSLFYWWLVKVEQKMKEGTGVSFAQNSETRRDLTQLRNKTERPTGCLLNNT